MGVLCRLTDTVIIMTSTEKKDPHQKENTNPSKDHFRRREYLQIETQTQDSNAIAT